jgi:hypothetical protein
MYLILMKFWWLIIFWMPRMRCYLLRFTMTAMSHAIRPQKVDWWLYIWHISCSARWNVYLNRNVHLADLDGWAILTLQSLRIFKVSWPLVSGLCLPHYFRRGVRVVE